MTGLSDAETVIPVFGSSNFAGKPATRARLVDRKLVRAIIRATIPEQRVTATHYHQYVPI